METACRHDREVLKIALTPASVARREIEQRGWHLFIASAERRQHVDAPTGPPHQRSLDEIVAEDVAAEGLPSAKLRQRSRFSKRLHPDDRVVSPVIALGTVPPSHAGRDHRSVQPARELLHAAEQTSRVDNHGKRLDEPGARIDLDGMDQSDDGLPAHETVGADRTPNNQNPPGYLVISRRIWKNWSKHTPVVLIGWLLLLNWLDRPSHGGGH